MASNVRNMEQDFRALLQQELVRRCRENPQFSLRAFAKTLHTEPSFLSKIMRGKRSVTPKFIKRVAPLLDVKPAAVERYCRAYANKSAVDLVEQSYQELAEDTLSFLSDWHHYAILQLTDLQDFQPESRWIAKQLGITVIEVNLAVQRLQRLGLLVMTPNGKWQQKHEFTTSSGVKGTSSALKQLQRQILRQAIEALAMVPTEERSQTSITMAVSTSQLPLARKKITEFQRHLVDILQTAGPKDRVYQLSVSLFPVSRKNL